MLTNDQIINPCKLRTIAWRQKNHPKNEIKEKKKEKKKEKLTIGKFLLGKHTT